MQQQAAPTANRKSIKLRQATGNRFQCQERAFHCYRPPSRRTCPCRQRGLRKWNRHLFQTHFPLVELPAFQEQYKNVLYRAVTTRLQCKIRFTQTRHMRDCTRGGTFLNQIVIDFRKSTPILIATCDSGVGGLSAEVCTFCYSLLPCQTPIQQAYVCEHNNLPVALTIMVRAVL